MAFQSPHKLAAAAALPFHSGKAPPAASTAAALMPPVCGSRIANFPAAAPMCAAAPWQQWAGLEGVSRGHSRSLQVFQGFYGAPLQGAVSHQESTLLLLLSSSALSLKLLSRHNGGCKELRARRLSEGSYWNSRSKAPQREQKHPATRSRGFGDERGGGGPAHVVQVIRTQRGVHMKESRLKQG